MVLNTLSLLFLIFFTKNISNKSKKAKHSLFRALHQLFQAGFKNLPALTNSKSHDNRFEFNYIINLLIIYIFTIFKFISIPSQAKISRLLLHLFFT